MTAPRSTSLRALRSLAQQHSPVPMAPSRRALHITGAYTAQPVAGNDVTTIYRARSLSDLRSECERRNLVTGGSKAELVDRLANHDHLQTRAFSIARRRIDGTFGGNARQFNTSQANKSVHDTSPVDLVYVPKTFDSSPPNHQGPRVPTPPDSYAHYEPTPSADSAMKPQIYSVADLGSDLQGPSPMSEVADNQTLDVDPFNLTETVSRSRNVAESPDAAKSYEDSVGGAVKQLWSGMLDDVLGPKQGAVSSKRG